MKRIAVVGASGFVGATLVERLLDKGDCEVVPLIHSSGSAWRLARRPVDLTLIDLLDATSLGSTLAGVTHVVNCSRGDNNVMLRGFRNLLATSHEAKVKRFIHLSSVAVYGDPPPPESVEESAPTAPAKGSYGWLKLRQDMMVRKAVAAGLQSVVLCPPNISGPYSAFLSMLVEIMRRGDFAQLEDGSAPCNLVDVGNLCHAIELSLEDGPADGNRLFVTDDDDTTWKDVLSHMESLAAGAAEIPVVSRERLGKLNVADSPKASVLKSIKHLVSSDVREALRKDPLLEKIDVSIRRGVGRLGRIVEGTLRQTIEGPTRVAKVIPGQRHYSPLAMQQLRGVRHSCARLKTAFGYMPQYSMTESMSAFRNWYRIHFGVDSDYWEMIRELY